MKKKIVFSHVDVLYELRMLQELEKQESLEWITEAAITEAIYGRYTHTARKRVRICLRALRKKGLVERRKRYKPASWRLVSVFDLSVKSE